MVYVFKCSIEVIYSYPSEKTVALCPIMVKASDEVDAYDQLDKQILHAAVIRVCPVKCDCVDIGRINRMKYCIPYAVKDEGIVFRLYQGGGPFFAGELMVMGLEAKLKLNPSHFNVGDHYEECEWRRSIEGARLAVKTEITSD